MARAGTNHKGGRPKGKKSAKTLEREAVLSAYRQRAMGIADRMLDKQLVLANGQQFLYKIEKEWVKTGNGAKAGYWRAKKPELVEDEATIRWYLENMVDETNGDIEKDYDPSATFYFITAKEPDSRTIDSILDRTFGRASQAVEVSGKDGIPLTVKIVNYGNSASA